MSALCLCKAKLTDDGTVLVLGATSPRVDAVLKVLALEDEFARDLPPEERPV